MAVSGFESLYPSGHMRGRKEELLSKQCLLQAWVPALPLRRPLTVNVLHRRPLQASGSSPIKWGPRITSWVVR